MKKISEMTDNELHDYHKSLRLEETTAAGNRDHDAIYHIRETIKEVKMEIDFRFRRQRINEDYKAEVQQRADEWEKSRKS